MPRISSFKNELELCCGTRFVEMQLGLGHLTSPIIREGQNTADLADGLESSLAGLNLGGCPLPPGLASPVLSVLRASRRRSQRAVPQEAFGAALNALLVWLTPDRAASGDHKPYSAVVSRRAASPREKARCGEFR
jgi:hypothetical protein